MKRARIVQWSLTVGCASLPLSHLFQNGKNDTALAPAQPSASACDSPPKQRSSWKNKKLQTSALRFFSWEEVKGLIQSPVIPKSLSFSLMLHLFFTDLYCCFSLLLGSTLSSTTQFTISFPSLSSCLISFFHHNLLGPAICCRIL